MNVSNVRIGKVTTTFAHTINYSLTVRVSSQLADALNLKQTEMTQKEAKFYAEQGIANTDIQSILDTLQVYPPEDATDRDIDKILTEQKKIVEKWITRISKRATLSD